MVPSYLVPEHLGTEQYWAIQKIVVLPVSNYLDNFLINFSSYK